MRIVLFFYFLRLMRLFAAIIFIRDRSGTVGLIGWFYEDLVNLWLFLSYASGASDQIRSHTQRSLSQPRSLINRLLGVGMMCGFPTCPTLKRNT